VDFQDRASSCQWQRNYADDLIVGHGRIVAEFFDEGVSRRTAWPDRPQAARLLEAITDPDRTQPKKRCYTPTSPSRINTSTADSLTVTTHQRRPTPFNPADLNHRSRY
jgi:hypothetical protein